MLPLTWSLAEVTRRAGLLREDIDQRRQNAELDVDDQGLHQSQIRALHAMMDRKLSQQHALIAGLTSAPQLPQYAATYDQLLTEIAGLQGLWRTFRYIFDQRRDAAVKRQLDAADLVAEDCYRSCMEQARGWGLINDELREPPLVYLDAALSALTASRGTETRALGMALGHYRALRLPIPIIVLPADQVNSFWLYSTLHHEVGHNLDQDLRPGGRGLRIAEELREAVLTRLAVDGVELDRRQIWQRWCEEILADAFGVLLAGAGFAFTMASLLLPRLARNTKVQTDGDHPDDYVRVALIVALLRLLKLPQLDAAAAWVHERWSLCPAPAEVSSYLKQAELVAALTLNTKYAPLGNRQLRALNPNLVLDADRAEQLATWLRTGFQRPPPKGFPRRLVPPAAQIALTRLANPDEAALVGLHQKALDYLLSIPRPKWLASENPRKAFLDTLTDSINFSAP